MPGWVRSTSVSFSTTGGVHRVEGSLITTGPLGPSERSGTVTSWARTAGVSLSRESVPRTVMMASSTR
jgi:hypothetical protein